KGRPPSFWDDAPVLSLVAVGTDGSDSASSAVAHAARLAEATGAELAVVHAYGGTGSLDSPVGTREIGASLLRDVAGRHVPTSRARAVLREGDPADVLLDVARQEGADLIVVGNRGMGRRPARIGNVPNRIAHRAPCDVLIAQTTRGRRQRTYGRVLLTTDGSPTAGRAVAVGARLASVVGADTVLLHVGADTSVAERTAAELQPDLTVEALTVEGDPARTIGDVAAERDCDLIVIGNRGMTGLRRFLASVPSRVAHEAPCHVLLVKTT
ncbi:MAG TPA: universal stress protein, partial [Actinomycetota bacterium]|nr:universal stress protein [Actinomycetota bacterium]